jgi:hypothetical protein
MANIRIRFCTTFSSSLYFILSCSDTEHLAYESVDAMNGLEHLAHTNDSIIAEYEEVAE